MEPITASDIFAWALALLGETPQKSRGYEQLAAPVLNQLLMRCFQTENALRRARGQIPLECPAAVQELGEPVDYDTRLCREILPLGLAALLILEDDPQRAAFFDWRFQNSLEQCAPAQFVPMEDCYP